MPLPRDSSLKDLYSFGGPPDFAFKEGPNVFSPRDLIEMASPGHGLANADGDLVLVPVSKYSMSERRTKRSVVISSLDSNLIPPLTVPLPNGGATFWLGSRTIGHAIPVENEKRTDLFAIELEYQRDSEGFAGVLRPLSKPSTIGSIPTLSAAHFRYVPASNCLVFSDYVYPDGEISNVKRLDKAWENRGTSALVYDSMYERHWNAWVGPKKKSLFVAKLCRDERKTWRLDDRIKNSLQGTGHSCPVEPFGGNDDFDVSNTDIVYTTLDPKLPEAVHTKQDVFIVAMDGSEVPRELTSGRQGATHNPVFNSPGDKVAWSELDEDGYETDRAKIVVYDLTKDIRFTITQSWDRSVASLAFSHAGHYLYLIAGDQAKFKAFVLPVPATPSVSTTHPVFDDALTTPVALTSDHSVSAPQSLPDGRLLLTQSSFASTNNIIVIRPLVEFYQRARQDGAIGTTSVDFSQVINFDDRALASKHLSRGKEFWFLGAEDKQVHGWVLTPQGFKRGDMRQWPAVLLIHGGPQDVWADRWSEHWNANVFAAQGYVTVLINPTGSTTFGQGFTDGITKGWGAKPMEDLLKGWKHILSEYPEVDQDRTVAMGASWGGYVINWIQGHPELGFNFKATVCHAGLFDVAYDGYSIDEPFFLNHDWGGRPWDDEAKELLRLYNPSNFLHKWSIPQLLLHGCKDYRVAETESIAAFHVLQQRGVPSRLVVFPDEAHFIACPLNVLKWHYEIFRWFDQFVGKASSSR